MLEMAKGVSISYKDGDNYYRVYIKKQILKKPEVHVAKFESKNAKCGIAIAHKISANTLRDIIEYRLIRLKLYVTKKIHKKLR